MTMPRRRQHAVLALFAAVGAAAVLVISQLPASAITVTGTPTPVTGNSTYFDGLGAPYGGCGLPQANLDSQDFVALNVFNTPNDYAYSTRPVPDASKIGMWNNGLNCGRYVQVTIGNFCTGVNDGAPNMAFCRNGSWVADSFNGATLTMIVADSCGDGNAWCRDDPYHLDLHKDSLSNFMKNGQPAGSMLPNNFNNRQITWQFVPAPNYSGDINVGFLNGANVWWPAISVSHLANGIHGVEYLQNGAWVTAKMDGDMGEAYILGGTTAGTNAFQIRVRDVNDALINGGRVYSFSIPSTCGSSCSPAYTATTYTTSGGSTSSPTVPPTTNPPTTPPTTRPPTTPPTTGGSSKACTATYSISSSWASNFQGGVTVANSGTSAISAWTVKWTFANGQVISQMWSGTPTQSGSAVTVTNVSYNGAIPVAGSQTFGFLASWNNSTNAIPTLTCTAT